MVTTLLALSGSVFAHLPSGRSIPAFPFAPGTAPVIDGDLADWVAVDETYAIGTEQFQDLVSGATVDERDFAARLLVGWSESENRLYFAARVLDDIHQIDRPGGSPVLMWQDDDMEVFVDADHSGGQFADFSELSDAEQLRLNGAEANHFVIAGPPPDGDFFLSFSAAAWYALDDGLYTAAAYSLEPDVGGLTATSYEMMLVPFDRIDMTAQFQSLRHDLEGGEVLGFNVHFNDFDRNSTVWDAVWSLSGGQNAFRLSERFTDLHLQEGDGSATAVEDISWGRVKAAFAAD